MLETCNLKFFHFFLGVNSSVVVPLWAINSVSLGSNPARSFTRNTDASFQQVH